MSDLKKFRFYKHYKNMPYKWLGEVRHSETLEELVLYETLYENKNGKLWVRPKDMFYEKIELNGEKKFRFEPIEFKIKNLNTLEGADKADFMKVYSKAFEYDPAALQRFEEKLANNLGLLAQIAYDGDAPVGCKVGFKESANIFYSRVGGVIPAYRSLGIASELMRQQHEWCQARGFKTIRTKSRNKFKEMIFLNLEFGFEIVACEKSEKGETKIVFEKKL